MVDALTLQKSGNSTPFCSKTTSPVFQLVCTTSRRSQVTSSYECTSEVKTRWTLSPGCFGGTLLFSDRPFAERMVSVISAFLVRLVSITGTDNQGVAWNFVVGARPKLGAPEV